MGKSNLKLVTLIFLFVLAFITFQQTAFAQPLRQQQTFSRYDTLRGSLGPGRTWWDVLKYDIWFTPNPADSTISGISYITYKVVGAQNFMQIDLQITVCRYS